LNSRLKTNLWVAYIGALLTWGVLAYAMIGDELRAGRLFAFEKDGRPFISDFVNIYNAAVLAKRCAVEPTDIYSPELQAESAAKLTFPVKAEEPFYLQVPPYFFAVVRPLAEGSIVTAWWIWCVGSVLALGYAMKLLIFDSIEGKFTRAVAVIATFAAFPEWEGIRSGNFSLWLAPGIILMWCWILQRPIAGALASCVALVKIQYLPIAAVTGLILGGKKFFATLALSTLILLVIAVAGVGLNNVLEFPAALVNSMHSSQISGVAANEMQNLRGELVLLTGSDGKIVNILSLVGLAAAVVSVALLWMRRDRAADGADFKLRASITTLLLLAASPHTHKHDYVIAVIPAVWLWSICSTKPGVSPKLKRCIESAIISFPLLSWIFFVLEPLFHYIFIQPYFLWCLFLLGVSIPLLKKPTQSPDAPVL